MLFTPRPTRTILDASQNVQAVYIGGGEWYKAAENISWIRHDIISIVLGNPVWYM